MAHLGAIAYSRSNNLPSLRRSSTISTFVLRGAVMSYELRRTSCMLSSRFVSEIFSSNAGGG